MEIISFWTKLFGRTLRLTLLLEPSRVSLISHASDEYTRFLRPNPNGCYVIRHVRGQ